MPAMTLTTLRPPRADEADVTCIGGSLDGWRVRVERGTPMFNVPRVPAGTASLPLQSMIETEVYRCVQIAAPDAAGAMMRIEVYATQDQSPAEVLRRLELGYSARTFERQSGDR